MTEAQGPANVPGRNASCPSKGAAPVHYVNFRNEQTFHLYRFLTTRPGGCVHQLVACAFDLASKDESIDVDGPTAVLREHIAMRVEEQVAHLAFENGFGSMPEHNEETAIGDE
jgi:hypothetical protein